MMSLVIKYFMLFLLYFHIQISAASSHFQLLFFLTNVVSCTKSQSQFSHGQQMVSIQYEICIVSVCEIRDNLEVFWQKT